MDKQTFYTELSDKLAKRNVSDEYIERHLKQFDVYFSEKSDEEISSEIEKLGDLDRVADRIKRMTDKIISEAQETEPASTPSDTNTSEAEASTTNQTAESANPISAEASITPHEDVKTAEDVPSEELLPYGIPADRNDKEIDELFLDDDDVSVAGSEAHVAKRGTAVQPSDNQESLVSVHLDQAALQKNRRKFWLLFAVTSPLWLTIILMTAAAFALTYFLMAVIIIAAVALLVATTAAGTLVSVFGLIFSVAQMISSLPIGLYECGLSIIAGAIAMFVSILIYNFAVRLIPFAARWLLVFVKYVFRKYKELFVYLKKECIGL